MHYEDIFGGRDVHIDPGLESDSLVRAMPEIFSSVLTSERSSRRLGLQKFDLLRTFLVLGAGDYETNASSGDYRQGSAGGQVRFCIVGLSLAQADVRQQGSRYRVGGALSRLCIGRAEGDGGNESTSQGVADNTFLVEGSCVDGPLYFGGLCFRSEFGCVRL